MERADFDERTTRKIEVDHLLKETRLFTELKEYTPLLVGTIPIALDVEGSDLDIICEVHAFESFERRVLGWIGQQDGVLLKSTRKVIRGVESIIIGCNVRGFPIEVFGQPIEVRSQYGFRHLCVEKRILQIGGEELRKKILQLRDAGSKTEPAFAEVLGLTGDSFERLLEVEQWYDYDIIQALTSSSTGTSL